MIDGVLFDKLVSPSLRWSSEHVLNQLFQEYIARALRRDEAPFGGIQVNSILTLICFLCVERYIFLSLCSPGIFVSYPLSRTITPRHVSLSTPIHGRVALTGRYSSPKFSDNGIKV